MHWELEITLLTFIVITAWGAISTRNLLTAAVTLTVFSFLMALVFVSMGAIDVGFTEAVVGAGVTGVFIIVVIFKTVRRSNDKPDLHFRYVKALALAAFGGLLVYGSTALPNRGDLTAQVNQETTQSGSVNAAAYYVQHAYEDAATPNIVTVILADYRSYDTLGEVVVILTAGLICFLLLRRMREPDETEG